MSPRKKKPKLSPSTTLNKRTSETPDSPRKRLKGTLSKEEEIKARRKKNFITACEQVSCRDYFDQRARLLLVYLPSCVKTICIHHDKNGVSILQKINSSIYYYKTYKITINEHYRITDDILMPRGKYFERFVIYQLELFILIPIYYFKRNIKQMPSYADESFKTEMKNNMWYEALEVCHMSITPTQYLSSDVLKDVVEIILVNKF